MKRTAIDDRALPAYTQKEEIFNMTTHIVGAAFGVCALVICIVLSVLRNHIMGLLGGMVYGLMMILVYTISSIYHGLSPSRAKKILQVLDHCSIYAMIVGTYMPILLTGILNYSRTLFTVQTVVLTVGTVVGVTFTAIDFHRYAGVAMSGYFVIGWSIIFASRHVIEAFCPRFFILIVAGGVVYSLGMIFFTLGIKRRYFHGVFHLFIIAGSFLQFLGIVQYCI